MIRLPIPPSDTWVNGLRLYGEVWGYLDEYVSKCSKTAANSCMSGVHMCSRTYKTPSKNWEVYRLAECIEVTAAPEYETILLLKYCDPSAES